MGEAFIVRRGGGGAFAMIFVNYPAGSTVTCTNSSGKKDISSTKTLFYVKKPSSGTSQTCVVTASLGTESDSQTITISEGQSQTVTLTYALVVWKNGDGLAAFNSKFSDYYGGSSASLSASGNIVVTLPTYEGNQSEMVSINQINVEDYRTLEIKVKKTGYSGVTSCGITRGGDFAGQFIASYHFTSDGESALTERRISIPGTTTTCYVAFIGSNSAQLEIEYIRFVR